LIGVAGVTTEIVTVPLSAGAPFSVSLPSTSITPAPPWPPLTGGTVSLVATMGAATTVTLAVAVAQLVGFSFSQIV
jgi:hypothetical protein